MRHFPLYIPGFIKELHTDIIEIRRGEEIFTLPAGDMVLQARDMLKVRCEAAHARELNADRHIRIHPATSKASDMGSENAEAGQHGTKLVELVITGNSPLDGKTIGEADLALPDTGSRSRTWPPGGCEWG